MLPEEGAANPAGEAVQVSDEQSSVKRVAQMLERQRTPTAPEQQEGPKTNRQEKPQAKVADQPKAAPEESEAGEEGTAEADPESPELVDGDEPLELPDRLEDLAEALGLTPEEFAARIKSKVKVDGRELEVNLAEALKGYQLEADYRQKTSSHAEQVRQFEANARQASEAISQRLQSAEELVVLLHQQLQGGPSEAEMRRLLDEDPYQYNRVKADMDLKRESLFRAQQTLAQHREQERQQREQAMLAYRREQQQRLVEVLPVFGDDTKRPAYEQNVRSVLKTVGFTDNDINAYFGGDFDHRHLLLIDKAMKWDAMEKGKPEIKKRLVALPKVQKPNPSSEKTSKEDQRSALRERLRKHGSRRGGDENTSIALVKSML